MINELKDLSFLELFIINTIVYFDIFDQPLTLAEIYNYLYTGGMSGGDCSLAELKDNLNNNDKLKKIITTKSGFYFLKNRQEIIETRLERYNLTDQKFKIAQKGLRMMKYIPFIKLIAVCNNLAYFNANKDSDIDLFIITRKKRIWLARFALVILIAILGLRPPKSKAKDKLCLSFYITEDDLDISKVKAAPDDIYLVYWLATLLPVYQREDFYNKLITNNNWLKKYLPNWQPNQIGYRYRVEDNKFNRFVYKSKEFVWGSFLGNPLEKLAKLTQLKKISQKKKDLAIHDDTRVIINDCMLKFHETDRRLEYLDKFEKKRKELIDQI
jgi:hypothetical protein